MTYFINFRSHAVGGWLDTSGAVRIQQSPPPTVSGFNQPAIDPARFVADIRGRHVLIATHGFNVDFASGVAALTSWSDLLHLPDASVFVGLLWPGDSVWAHGLDYPEEPRVADEAGEKLATLIDTTLADASDISFVSHSLGARVVLQAVNRMSRRARRVVLMAGAIDDNCLQTEFQSAAQRIDKISVLASRKDEVLALAFPLGNLLGGILDKGHPWWHSALGRDGPAKPTPANFDAPFQIPQNWDYGHHDYLQIKPPYTGATAGDEDVPPESSPFPLGGAAGWQEAFSAAFVATRLK
jgi:Alpha/beta hydrolase of unknown function (DUF900)